MDIHTRQFVIGPRTVLPGETWKTEQIDGSTWLSYCSKLKISRATDADGKHWHILGLAIETSGEHETPEKQISNTKSEQVKDLTPSWTGRWILVGDGQLYPDASGLLGCFYGKDSEAKVWTSSSPALIRQSIFPEQEPTVDPRRLIYGNGISWYTPPRSRFEGISRLLPSQVLDMKRGVTQSKPLMPDIITERDYESTLEEVQRILLVALQRLSSLGSTLWLGLTAGYDSRVMLALSYQAGISVRPFTRIAARMSVADRILPPKLARECGYSHQFIDKQNHPERKIAAEQHTALHVSEGDAEPFIQGTRDGLDGIAFGGHGFSIASGFGNLRKLPKTLTCAEEGAGQIAELFREPLNSSAITGIKDWLAWVLKYPQDNLDWRDRFFIEQRNAGWLSSKEQVYDLVDEPIRFPILNSAYLYSLFLSIDEDMRLGSRTQRTLIERMNPKLCRYPFNPHDSYFSPLEIVAAKRKDLPKYLLLQLIKTFN